MPIILQTCCSSCTTQLSAQKFAAHLSALCPVCNCELQELESADVLPFDFRSGERRAAEVKPAAPEEQEDGEVEAAGAVASEPQPTGKQHPSNASLTTSESVMPSIVAETHRTGHAKSQHCLSNLLSVSTA